MSVQVDAPVVERSQEDVQQLVRERYDEILNARETIAEEKLFRWLLALFPNRPEDDLMTMLDNPSRFQFYFSQVLNFTHVSEWDLSFEELLDLSIERINSSFVPYGVIQGPKAHAVPYKPPLSPLVNLEFADLPISAEMYDIDIRRLARTFNDFISKLIIQVAKKRGELTNINVRELLGIIDANNAEQIKALFKNDPLISTLVDIVIQMTNITEGLRALDKKGRWIDMREVRELTYRIINLIATKVATSRDIELSLSELSTYIKTILEKLEVYTAKQRELYNEAFAYQREHKEEEGLDQEIQAILDEIIPVEKSVSEELNELLEVMNATYEAAAIPTSMPVIASPLVSIEEAEGPLLPAAPDLSDERSKLLENAEDVRVWGEQVYNDETLVAELTIILKEHEALIREKLPRATRDIPELASGDINRVKKILKNWLYDDFKVRGESKGKVWDKFGKENMAEIISIVRAHA